MARGKSANLVPGWQATLRPPKNLGGHAANNPLRALLLCKPMSSFQTALSSARFNRYLMWFSVLVLAVGVGFLAIRLVPGNDKTQVSADKGFVPQLPAKSLPLTNAKGAQIEDVRGARSAGAGDDPHVPRERGRPEAPRQSLACHRSVDEAGLHTPVVVAREGAPDRSVSDRERRLDAVLPRLRVDEGDPSRGRPKHNGASRSC